MNFYFIKILLTFTKYDIVYISLIIAVKKIFGFLIVTNITCFYISDIQNEKKEGWINKNIFPVPIDFGDTEEFQTPIIHTDALIKCHVTASPAPEIDWRKDGKPLNTGEVNFISLHYFCYNITDDS